MVIFTHPLFLFIIFSVVGHGLHRHLRPELPSRHTLFMRTCFALSIIYTLMAVAFFKIKVDYFASGQIFFLGVLTLVAYAFYRLVIIFKNSWRKWILAIVLTVLFLWVVKGLVSYFLDLTWLPDCNGGHLIEKQGKDYWQSFLSSTSLVDYCRYK